MSNDSFYIKLECICYAFTFYNKTRKKPYTPLCCVGSEAVVSLVMEHKTYLESKSLEVFYMITTTWACITPTLKVNI